MASEISPTVALARTAGNAAANRLPSVRGRLGDGGQGFLERSLRPRRALILVQSFDLFMAN